MGLSMRRIGKRLLGLVYPEVCEICGCSLLEGESVMCLQCLYDLPRTHSHHERFNLVHRRLASTLPLERAAAWFHYYRGSPYSGIIHRAKYNNRPSLLRKMGQRMARELNQDGFFNGVDLILPVPMHRWKLIKRGYNQSQCLAEGLSSVTGIPVGDNLVALKAHKTQTQQSLFRRWLNARDLYGVRRPEVIGGLHVLVVDDVITTGATMLACCNAIAEASPGTKVSVLSLGITHML